MYVENYQAYSDSFIRISMRINGRLPDTSLAFNKLTGISG